MTYQQGMLIALLLATLGMFMWGRFRYDIVAMGALLLAVFIGLVDGADAFSGFGHPAVVTVAAVFVISRALQNTPLVDRMAELTFRATKNLTLHIFVLMVLVIFCSAFMNNVGALALILPTALQSATIAKRSPSRILMPVSFGSLLGGLITLIGTPPNIIIATYRQDVLGESFKMFDFAPTGIVASIAGLAFISIIGWRLLPDRTEANKVKRDLLNIDDYIIEVKLTAESPLVGKRVTDLENLVQGDISVVAVHRRGDKILAPSGYLHLQAGDILLLEGDTTSLRKTADKARIDIIDASGYSQENLSSEKVGLYEAVITPGSKMERETARSLSLHPQYGVNLLAIARRGEPVRERLGRVKLAVGDVLLLQGDRERMPDILSSLGCLPLADRSEDIIKQSGGWTTILLFGAAVLTLVFGLLPPQVAFVAAAFGLIITGEIELKDFYESIEWPIIILLGSLIPIGYALETTGATAVLVEPLIHLGGVVPIWALLAILMLVTMVLTDVINNAATAVIMAPIGYSLALGLGLNPDSFLIAVAIAASSTYLTPIGHQSNLLVMGPGGYRFGDYWRMGLPLDIIIVVVSVPAIMIFWPLGG